MMDSDQLDEAKERITAMESAFRDLLEWTSDRRSAVISNLRIEERVKRTHTQSCDTSISDIKRAAGSCGVEL